MIVFRRPRSRGVASRVRVRANRPGLSEREVASLLAPRATGLVEFSPVVEPPEHPDGSIDPDERSQWAHRLP